MGGRDHTSGLKVLLPGCLWAENLRTQKGNSEFILNAVGWWGEVHRLLVTVMMQACGCPSNPPAPERREITHCHYSSQPR